MEQVKQHIYLDIKKNGYQQTIYARCGDVEGMVLCFHLSNGAADYKIENTDTAVFRALKPDGTYIYNNCDVDMVSGMASTVITSQCVASEGIVEGELQILDSEKVLYSPKFKIIVESNLYDDSAVESASEYTELTTMIASAQTAISNAETATTNAETATANAETATANAETATANAETAITATQTATSEAYTAIDKLNEAITQAESDVATAVGNAETATTSASEAAEYAREQGDYAKAQADVASTAVEDAEKASALANEAAEKAETATTKIDEAVEKAEGAVTEAETAVSNANTAVENANTAITQANEASDRATEAAEKAETATGNANTATANANEAISNMTQLQAAMTNISVTTNTLEAGSKATVAVTIGDSNTDYTFGIPQGEKGEKGDPGESGSYTAGDNIIIEDGTISAVDTTYTAGSNVTISGTTISAIDTTYSAATTSAAGLMSASDKTKLNGIATGATATDYTATSTSGSGTGSATSGTWTTLGNITVPAGRTIITGSVIFSTNSTGFRQAVVTTSSSGTSGDARGLDPCIPANSSTSTSVAFAGAVYNSSDTKYYVRTRNNAGAALTESWGIQAVTFTK